MSTPQIRDNQPAYPGSDRRGQDGFSLVETMLSMLLMLVILLSVAQLLGLSASVNRAADDLTKVTSLASEQMEQLKYLQYSTLAAGGSLTIDTTGYFDNIDEDANGVIDYVRRWQVTDLGNRKQIDVRVVSQLQAHGEAKETTVAAIVAPR